MIPNGYFSKFWKSYVMILAPICLLPVALSNGSEEMRCAYVVLLMATYWMTEVLPLPITSLIPLVAFPLLGILSTNEVAINYLKSTNFMFIGGLILAILVQESGLHKRIALIILLKIGTSPHLILLGFMITTAFLSMWISNTATASMMVPIVNAMDLVTNIHESTNKEEMELIENDETGCGGCQSKDKKDKIERQKKLLLLGVAYSANIGGTGVITGSPPNLVVPNVLNEKYGPGTGLTYASWMAFAVPVMCVNLIISWLWLLFVHNRREKKFNVRGGSGGVTQEVEANRVKSILKEQYESLGRVSVSEWTILICFISVVCLWFFKTPMFMPGWGDLFKVVTNRGKTITVGSATPAILMVIIIFALPSRYKFWPFRKLTHATSSDPLITWKTIEKELPWGVIILLGGGFALSDACEKSGLSLWIVDKLMILEGLPIVLVQIIVCTTTAVITQVASNTATANVLLPILTNMSVTFCNNPIYLLMSTALTCSYAFMLPVATAPNAIVFQASKSMRTIDMIEMGFGINVITLISTSLAINTYAIPLFDLNTFPEWASHQNPACLASLNSTIAL